MSARPKPSPARLPTFYRPDRYQPEESVAYLMRRILQALSTEAERRFEPSGLTSAQWVPLLMLHMGRASMVAELARECQLDAGGMTRLLDRLESKGLVRRARSSADRRVVNIELTPAGRAAAAEIPAVLCGVHNAALAGFTADEWQLLRQLLTRVLANATALQSAGEAPA
jgi:DNA-binding MarR family transcriptional regulator